LLANNGFTRLATSGVLTVTPATGLTASSAVVTAGGGTDVAWTGIAMPTSTAWIGLYTPGAPHTPFLASTYVSCKQTPPALSRAAPLPRAPPPQNPPPPPRHQRILHRHRHRPSAERQPRRNQHGRIGDRDVEWHRRPHCHRLDWPVYPWRRGHCVPRLGL